MLKSLILKNFQSHKNSIFKFINGVNAITGTSRHGKSASLRAINWVVNNRPSGDGNVSFWAWDEKKKQIEPTSVILETDEHVIERIRSADRNSYILDGKQLDAIGTDVPKEVQVALGFTEVNIQSQMDQPFLLSESSGEVGKFFNKIVKLDSIDQFQSALDSKKRKTKADLEINKDNLERTEKELVAYGWVEKAKETIEKLELLEKKSESLYLKKENLAQSITKYSEFQEILLKVKIIPDALVLCENIYEKTLNHKVLLKKQESIQSYQYEYTKHKNILDKCSATNIPYAEKIVSRIGRFGEMNKESYNLMTKLKTAIDLYTSNQNILKSFDTEYDVLKQSLPTLCPTCGKPLEEING